MSAEALRAMTPWMVAGLLDLADHEPDPRHRRMAQVTEGHERAGRFVEYIEQLCREVGP